MDKKRQTLTGGRFSFAPNGLMKTPNRSRLTLNANTPSLTKTNPRFSLGGMQTASKSRLSVFKAPQLAGQPKDTGDKQAQMRMVKKIHAFLVERDGDDQVPSEASIARPSMNDFISIFEKIYECLSPNYEFTKEKKLTDEIPRIFNGLGYQYTIKTATLQTVGAPHSWHYLLHALCWLIDFILKTEAISVGPQILLGGDESNGHLKAYRVSWMTKHFHEYQRNVNIINYQPYLDGAAREIKDFHENNENIQGQINQLENHLRLIQADIDEYRADMGEENDLREQIRKVDDDIKRMKAYVEGLEVHVPQQIAEAEAEAAETLQLKQVVDNLKAEVMQKKAAIDEQFRTKSIRGDQAKAIMSEYNQLKHQLRESQKDMEQLNKEQWLNQPKANESFVQLMSRFRQGVSIMKNIAADVGHSMEIFDENAIRSPKDLQNALVKEVRHEMEAIRATIENLKAQTDKEIKAMEMKRSHADNRCQVEEEKLADTSRRLQRRRLAIQNLTEESKNDRRKEQLTIEKLEVEKDALLQRQRGVAVLQQDLEMVRRDFEETVRRAEAQKAEFESGLAKSVEGAFDAIEKIQKERGKLESFKLELKDWRTKKFANI